MPRFKVDYTSRRIHSQIYISFVNWFLLFSVPFIMFLFRSSDRLASAYGLAVTGTMTLTEIMMTWIFIRRRDFFKVRLSFFVTLVDLGFLVSKTDKIPYGGYWSLVIAAVSLSVILIYTAGQKRLYKSAQPLTLNAFLTQYVQAYRAKTRIDGSALFFVRSMYEVPPST